MARNPSGGAAQNTAKIAGNLRQATGAARSLAFATAGVTGQLNGAVGASAVIAENIAKASSNAKIAASATGIGAVVAILATVAAFTINWKKETEEVANKVRDIRNATAQLEAQAKGNKRLERELEIQSAMDGELDAAKKMEHWYRKFPELQEAIRKKAQASRDAVIADTRRAFGNELFELQNSKNSVAPGPTREQEFLRRQRELQLQRERQLHDIDEHARDRGYGAEQIDRLKDEVSDAFDIGMRDLRYDLDEPARQLGDQLGKSIIDGITDGISAALHGNLGAGFKALTGGILIGFGEMMQSIGTQSLLAAQLLKKVIDSFRAFAPEGAIAASLALIAGGAILKSLGGSMQGAGAAGAGSIGYSGRGALLGSVVSIGAGPVAAAGGPDALSMAGGGITNVWVIGADDAIAQRTLATMVDKGNLRRGRK